MANLKMAKSDKNLLLILMFPCQDYTFGFGSFSDKPTAPFSAEMNYYAHKRYPIPYAFRHEGLIL
jgi:hypothetical protein